MPSFIKERVILAPYTTLGVGGPAELFAEVHSLEELREAVAWAQTHRYPVTILGGGSNVLIPDKGIKGLVVRPQCTGIEYREEGAHTLVRVGAGVILDTLIHELVQKKLWGLENFSSIPGTVGAVPIQNVGAYGVEAKDVVHSVTVLDVDTDTVYDMTNAQCAFAYRDSYFKRAGKNSSIILSVTFLCTTIPRPNLEYKELKEIFKHSEDISIESVRDAIIHIRSKKFPNWMETGTAGSFFKNPIIEKENYESLLRTYPELPGYALPENKVKIPLGWVLDHICNVRGYTEGNVGLFEHQALVLVCAKNTSADEIEKFSQNIIDRVYQMTHIVVEREVTALM